MLLLEKLLWIDATHVLVVLFGFIDHGCKVHFLIRSIVAATSTSAIHVSLKRGFHTLLYCLTVLQLVGSSSLLLSIMCCWSLSWTTSTQTAFWRICWPMHDSTSGASLATAITSRGTSLSAAVPEWFWDDDNNSRDISTDCWLFSLFVVSAAVSILADDTCGERHPISCHLADWPSTTWYASWLGLFFFCWLQRMMCLVCSRDHHCLFSKIFLFLASLSCIHLSILSTPPEFSSGCSNGIQYYMKIFHSS